MQSKKLLLDGRWEDGEGHFEIRSPYTGDLVGSVAKAIKAQADSAIRAAISASVEMRDMPRYEISRSLERISRQLYQRRNEFAESIALESAKPIRHAGAEVDRAISTFRIAASETLRFCGEVVTVEVSENAKGYRAQTGFFPRGVIFGITPFNYPLNLVAHKVAPALASGNAIIIKPSEKTPLTSVLLGDVFLNSGLPKGALQIINMDLDVLNDVLKDPGIAMISFTGSDSVGWGLKARHPRKAFALELGGNAPVIVDETCDLDDAASRIALGAYAYSGQVCISVQRILVQSNIYEELVNKISDFVANLKKGDPLLDSTDLSVMISKQAAENTIEIIREAVDGGAEIIFGGEADGSYVQPTLVSGVSSKMRIVKDEVFGPVATIERFTDIHDGVSKANDSRFGLQAGVFSNNLKNVEYASQKLDYGGVIINDVPTFRVDNMPYGGIKDSGYGREGVRYAMEEMSERKVIVTRTRVL
jgi:glyceraldehyde-3-phosphate dehydrogenase (NADP+)